MARRISELFFELRAHTEGLNQDLDTAERQLGKWEQFVVAHPIATAGALAAGILEIGVKAVEMAAKTDASFRQMAANLPTFTQGITQLREELGRLAIDSGRGLDEVHALAAEIAKSGVADANAVSEQAKAAILLSDATGVSAQDAASLLIQLRREFGQTDDQALKTAADLAAAARGRADITELFAAFQRATPVFQKFNIDAQTGTEAIAALVASGRNARAVGSDLAKMDAPGIRQLAVEAKVSADSLDELRTRAALVEDGTDRASQRIKTEFQQTLERLGATLEVHVNPLLRELDNLLDPVARKADLVADAFKSLETALPKSGSVSVEQQGAVADLERLLNRKGANEQQLFAGQSPADLQKVIGTVQALNAVDGQHTGLLYALSAALSRATEAQNTNSAAQNKAIGDSAKRVAAIIAESEARVAAGKKADEERAKIASLGVEFDRLTASDDNAVTRSQAFASAIEAYTDRAKKAHLPTDALNSDLDVLNAKLGKLKAEDARNLADEIGKALGELTGNTADAASDAIDKQVKHWKDAIAATTTYDQATRDTLNGQIAKWGQLKPVVDAAAESIRKAQSTLATIESHGPSSNITTLASDQIEAQARLFDLQAQRRSLLANGATTSSQEYLDVQREIDSVQKDLDAIGKRLLGYSTDSVKPAQDTLRNVIEQARAIRDAVDGALQLAGAFHLVSDITATVLRDVAEVTTQIPVLVKAVQDYNKYKFDPSTGTSSRLASGPEVLAAALPIVGGIASLVSSLTGESPAEKARKQAIEDNSAALRQLTTKLSTVSGTTQTGAAAVLGPGFLQAAFDQLVKNFPSKGDNIDLGKLGLTVEEIDALSKAAAAYGIKLDGSIESLAALKQASDEAGKALGRLGTDYQSDQTYFSGLSSIEGLQGVDAFNVNALAGASQSPFLAQLLGGFDLNSQAGRDAAKQQLLGAYQRGAPNSANPFTGAELGGLDTAQMEAAIKQWVDSLNGLPPLVVAAADKLKADLGDLSQKASVLGETSVEALADKVKTYAADLGPAFAQLAAGLDLTKQSDVDAFNERLKEFYQSLLDGTAGVDTSVTSLDDWKSAIADVSGAVSAAAGTFESAAQKINDALNAIDVAANIEGTSPVDVIQQKAAVQGFGVLANYDLNTQAGRDAAKAELKSIFENGLSPSDSNYQAWAATISGLITSINQLPAIAGADSGASIDASAAASSGSSGSASTSVGSNAATVATQSSVDRMGDYLATILQVNRDELAAQLRILDAITRPVITGPLLPPILPSWFGAAPGAAAAGARRAASTTTVVQHQDIQNFYLELHLDGSTFLMDKTDAGKFSQQMGEWINAYLGSKFRDSQRLRGDASIPSGAPGNPLV